MFISLAQRRVANNGRHDLALDQDVLPVEVVPGTVVEKAAVDDGEPPSNGPLVTQPTRNFRVIRSLN